MLSRLPVPVLCYHAIRDWTANDRPDDRAYIVPTARFAAEMDLLERQGYATISPEQLLAFLTVGAALPERPVLLTFDDADGTQWSNALPVLKAHHFTATFFIMTVVLDKPGYLSREQVRELDRMGMTIGAHTWDHHALTKYAEADWARQITKPTEELAGLVGHPIRYFAYPYGLWSQQVLTRPELSEFAAAFSLEDGPDPHQPLLTLPRRIANGYWSDARFAEALAQMQPHKLPVTGKQTATPVPRSTAPGRG